MSFFLVCLILSNAYLIENILNYIIRKVSNFHGTLGYKFEHYIILDLKCGITKINEIEFIYLLQENGARNRESGRCT